MRDDVVQRAVDFGAIERLQRAYADVINRRHWPDLHHLFAADAVVELDLVTSPPRTIVGPDELGAFIGGALERFTFFEFVILNTHVDLWPDGDRDAARARVFMCELRLPVGETTRTDAFGLYQDRYVRTPDGDGWLIAERRYRSMGRFPPGDTFPLPPLPTFGDPG